MIEDLTPTLQQLVHGEVRQRRGGQPQAGFHLLPLPPLLLAGLCAAAAGPFSAIGAAGRGSGSAGDLADAAEGRQGTTTPPPALLLPLLGRPLQRPRLPDCGRGQ